MRRASGFGKPSRIWCIRTLAFVLALVPAAVLTAPGEAAAQASVELSIEPASVDENGGSQQVTVKATVPDASTMPVVLLLKPVPDQSTATIPDDLMAPSLDQPIVIETGKTEGELVVTVVPADDDVYEGTETFVLVGVAVATGEPLTMPVSLEINDDEQAPTFTLSTTPEMIEEGGGPQQVTITATATVASSESTAIALAHVPGQSTATIPDDLMAPPLDQPIVIAPGETEGVLEITVVPTDDEIYEGAETYVFRGVGATGEPLTEPVALEIIDDETVPAITLSATPDMIDESDGPQVGVVTATASWVSATDLHVALVPLLEQSTATLIGPDADLAVPELAANPNIVITIPAGQPTGSINLTVVPVDDQVYETDEFAVFAGNLMGTISEPVVITIVDNDTPEIVLSGVPVALREDGGAQTVSFDVEMSGITVPIPTVITLEMTGSATPDADYASSGTAEIVIPAGETTAGTQITYTVVDDEVYEPVNETIVVTARWNFEDLDVVTLTIIDNYRAPVVVSPISDVTLISGATFRADLATTFSGKDLTYSVSATGDAISAAIVDTTLVVTANYLGSGRVTVAATNAAGSVRYNFGVTVAASFNLSATPVTLREGGGAQTVSFAVELSGSAVSVPTAITLDIGGTATRGTDYTVSGSTEIVIPAGGQLSETQLVFTVLEDEVFEPSDETIVVSANLDGSEIDSVTLTIADDFPAPEVTGAITDLTLESGDTRELDVAASFSGKSLAFSASSSSEAVTAEISGSTLSVTAKRKGSARVTVTATNDAGSTSTDFGVTVTTLAEERMVYNDVLAAMGRGIMASVSGTIGGRFSLTAAERQIAIGNRRVDGMAAGLEAVIGLTGTRKTEKYGMADGAADRNGARPVSARELMRGTAFYYAFDDVPQSGGGYGLSYTLWGAGDWNAFKGSASETASYDGSLISAYLGLDVAKIDSWIAGVAVGRTMGSSDYDVTISKGTLETTLNSVYPYVLWKAPSWNYEFWGIGGFGSGEVKANAMASDLSMRLFLFGGRSQLAGSVADGLDLDLIGDAGFASLSSADGESVSLNGLEAGVLRVRLGLEGSLNTTMDNGMFVTPFVQVAGRYDGGDGQTGGGLEITGGVHVERGRAGVEARGRLLAVHSGEEVSEHGISLAAYVKPLDAGGQGFFMALVPRIGADTDVSGDMWREEPMMGLKRPSRPGAGLKAEIGYGLANPAMTGILVTPFGAMDVAGDDRRRVRLGARIGSTGGATGGTPGALSFELAGERIEGNGRMPDHRIGLLGRMSF